MTWFFYALASAALWGVSYALYEQMMKTLSAASTMLYSSLGGIVLFFLLASANGTLARDWQIVRSGGSEAKILLTVILVNTAANMLMLMSVKEKNATVAGMVEITYPLFTAIFAWLFFKQMQLTMGSMLGFCLIVAGIACIYLFEKPA